MLPLTRKNDIWLALALLLIGICLYFAPGLFTPHAAADSANVLVSIDGETYREVPLRPDTTETFRIPTLYGTNVIHIENGCVSVTQTSCPDKLCVRHGAISRPGEIIVCLPNRVVVTITGSDEEMDTVVR